jgi:hypothetical protein
MEPRHLAAMVAMELHLLLQAQALHGPGVVVVALILTPASRTGEPLEQVALAVVVLVLREQTLTELVGALTQVEVVVLPDTIKPLLQTLETEATAALA